MQTGIYYWFGYPIPSKERLEMIASAGFDNISLWWWDEYADIDGPKELLPDLARNNGLTVENIHAPFARTNLLWVDKVGWEDVVERYLKCVDACYNHQIPAMVLHLTNGDTPPLPSSLGIDRIKRIVDRAEQKNIYIALENLRKSEYLDYVFSKIDSDKLKFCYDSGHENCYSKTNNLLQKHGDKLIALHLHDNDGTEDQHCIPGEGNICWDKIIDELVQLKYGGAISLEVTNEFSEKHKHSSAGKFLSEAFLKAKELGIRCSKQR